MVINRSNRDRLRMILGIIKGVKIMLENRECLIKCFEWISISVVIVLIIVVMVVDIKVICNVI